MAELLQIYSVKSNIDTLRTAHINFLQPLSAQAQQARKIDMSNTVAVLGYFDYITTFKHVILGKSTVQTDTQRLAHWMLRAGSQKLWIEYNRIGLQICSSCVRYDLRPMSKKEREWVCHISAWHFNFQSFVRTI